MSIYMPIISIYSNMVKATLTGQFMLFPMIGLFIGGVLYFKHMGRQANKQWDEAKAKWQQFHQWLKSPTIYGAKNLVSHYGINTVFHESPNELIYSDPTGYKNKIVMGWGQSYTLLSAAVWRNNLELVKFFLREGADITRLDESLIRYLAACHDSALNGTNFMPVLHCLIEHGLDINRDFSIGDISSIIEYMHTYKTAIDEKAHFEEAISTEALATPKPNRKKI